MTQKPEASWEKEFEQEWVFLYGEPPEKEAIKSFIHQAIEEAVSAERKRIEEAVKGLELDEQFIGPLFNAGHSAALGKVLYIINSKI